MKIKLLLIAVFGLSYAVAQGPTDFEHRYEFNNTLNNTVGSNPLTGTPANPSYVSDRFSAPQEALNPNGNRLESIVLNNVSDVSISFWIKAPSSTPVGDIVSLINSNSTRQGRMILSKDNLNRLVATFTSRNANPSAFSTITVFDDVWHHIVYTTRRRTNDHQNFVYVDGAGSLNQNINPSVSNGLFVDDAILAIAGGNQFNGIIDDLRIYDRELTFAEVTALYNSYVFIPDANFKAELVGNPNINTDGDTEISYTEAQAYTGTIDVFNKGISDLTGIGAFTNITILYVNNNLLTTLDVSNNTNLNTLYFNNNQLTEVDVSANTNLTVLYAFNNQLTSLNVANGNNSNMTVMRAENNPSLTCIQHDTGFDPTTNSNWIKNAGATWSNNCSALDINSFDFKDTIALYPNPVNTILNISSRNSELSKIEIFSLEGKQILTTASQRIDISQLKSGVYFLKAKAHDGSIATKRFIKK